MASIEAVGPNWVMPCSEYTIIAMPVRMGQRASTRPIIRPTTIMLNIVPTPRGANTKPIVSTG